MKIADFRIQTTDPDAPAANLVGVFADASGRLVAKEVGGRTFQAGTFFTGSVGNGSIATGGSATLTSGTVFGNNGGVQTGLGHPFTWLPVRGPNNENLFVPAYSAR